MYSQQNPGNYQGAGGYPIVLQGTQSSPVALPVPPGGAWSRWGAGNTGIEEPLALQRGVKVMMIGFRASGKSTFLAAMWHHFSNEGSGGVVFRTDEPSRRELDRYVQQIYAGELPSPSVGAREWRFTVQAEGLSGNLADAFTLTYIDYPGEELDRLFEVPGDNAHLEPADERVLAALADYDVITAVLDGDMIFEIMQNHHIPAYSQWLFKLFRLISMQGDKTVHLVLTKYDRLIGNYTLEQIVAKLRGQYRPFDQFCESQRTKLTRKRLIAVSALGTNGFATPTTDGKVDLHPELPWDYGDAMRPIVCTLPDALEGELRKLRGAAPGFRPSKASRGLSWRIYPLLAWAAEIFASDVDMKFPLDHAMTARDRPWIMSAARSRRSRDSSCGVTRRKLRGCASAPPTSTRHTPPSPARTSPIGATLGCSAWRARAHSRSPAAAPP